MNMTLDGICDHTVMTADDEIHRHYCDLLRNTDTIVYGRVTYQLMESYWPTIVENPTEDKVSNEFAVLLNDIEKIVFSNTLQSVNWKNAQLAKAGIQDVFTALKQQSGGDIAVGSPGLISSTLNLGLVDELQICVQPIIEGKGHDLFRDIKSRIDMKLERTKLLSDSGSMVFYYEILKR